MEKSEIKAEKIKTYSLPLIDIIARHYNTFKYLILAVIIFIPLITILSIKHFQWQWFLYLSLLEIFFVYIIIRALLNLRDDGKYRKWCEDMKRNPDHASMYTGAPGMGKTLTAVHATYWMAVGSWRRLQHEYFCLMGRMQKKNYVQTEDDKEIYESYQYMIKNPGIPCLGTNIPVYSKRYKRYSYKLGPSYLKQQRRAPFRLCGLYDEIGTVFNFELSNDKSDNQQGLTIQDMVRFCRQHAEFRFIGTEQEGGNMFKGIRNVVARYREYINLEYIFKPKFLQWIYDKMDNHFIDPIFGKGMNMLKAKVWGEFMEKFEKFIKKVGYVKLRYKDFGRKEECLTDKKGGDVLYLPCCAEFEYDTRAFRFAYKARYTPIKMQVFTEMKLPAEEAGAFLRANYPKEKEEAKKKKVA